MGLFSRILGRPAPTPAARPAPAAPPSRPAQPPVAKGPGLVAFFTEDHRACDRVWAEVEAATDDAAAIEAFRRFDGEVRRHLKWEEEVLFPAFEDATGHHGFGPTEIMKGEHAQMRAVLDEMARCATTGDRAGLVEQGDTLMMLIQQHNAKEEGMLYPMADQAFGDAGWAAMAPRFT